MHHEYFVLDKDPKTAAKYHNDRHVVKMILEGVQMMASPYYTNNGVVQRSQAHDYQHQLIKNTAPFHVKNFMVLVTIHILVLDGFNTHIKIGCG